MVHLKKLLHLLFFFVCVLTLWLHLIYCIRTSRWNYIFQITIVFPTEQTSWHCCCPCYPQLPKAATPVHASSIPAVVSLYYSICSPKSRVARSFEHTALAAIWQNMVTCVESWQVCCVLRCVLHRLVHICNAFFFSWRKQIGEFYNSSLVARAESAVCGGMTSIECHPGNSQRYRWHW